MQTTANVTAKEYKTNTKDVSSNNTSNRVGKTFKEQISTITKLSALKPDLDSALTNPTTETTINKETPTIKITLLSQDTKRNEDARALRNYVTLNRLRTTTEESPAEETTTASKDIITKRVYGTLNRNKTVQPTNNLINAEIEEQTAISEEDLDSSAGQRTFNRFRKPSTPLTAKRPIADNLNDKIVTNNRASGIDIANDPIESTTRRSLITINRTNFRATVVKTIEELDESNDSDDVSFSTPAAETTTDATLIKTTRRPLNALYNSRLRTTTAKTSDVVAENEENNSVDQANVSNGSTTSKTVEKTTPLNSIYSSKFKSTEVGVKNEEVEVQSSIENPTSEPQEETTRRPLYSIISSKFRAKTTKTTVGNNESEESDSQEVTYASIERTTFEPMEQTTRRPLNSTNSSKFKTATGKTKEEKDKEVYEATVSVDSTTSEALESTNLRLLNSIKSSNFRTTNAKTAIEDNDIEKNYSVDETTRSTEITTSESLQKISPAPLVSINSSRFRTTTAKSTDEDDDIEERNKAKETNASIEVTTSEPLEKTTRRGFNIVNSSRFRTTTVKTSDEEGENEENNIEEEVTASNSASLQKTTRRTLNSINSSRFRTTTSKTKVSIEEESTGASTHESAGKPLDSTTRRAYNSTNRLNYKKISAKTVDEYEEDSEDEFVKEETVTTTRRPLITLTKFRTTAEGSLRDQSSAEDKIEEVTTTNGTPRRAYSALNRSAVKNRTKNEENSSEQTVKDKTNTTKAGKLNTTASKTRIYTELNRKSLATKQPVVTSDAADTTRTESSTEDVHKLNYKTLNRVSSKAASSNDADSVTIDNEDEIKEEEYVPTAEDTTESTYSTLNRIRTTTHNSEEITPNESDATTSKTEGSSIPLERDESEQSDENTTEIASDSDNNNTASSVESTNANTTESEKNTVAARPPVLIRKRIYVTTITSAPPEETTTEESIDTTTESTSRRTVIIRKRIQGSTTQAPTTEAATEEAQNETTKEETVLKATRIPLLIRRRLNATSTTTTETPKPVDVTSMNVESTTHRTFAGFNRQRLSTTTQLPAESLTNVDYVEMVRTETTTTTKKIAFGQTNRHRALLLPTIETSTATTEESESESADVTEPTQRSKFAASANRKFGTASAENLQSTQAPVAEVTATRRFNKVNRFRATTEAASDAQSAEDSTEASTDSTTHRTFGFKRAKTTAAIPGKIVEDLATKRTFNVFAQKTRPTATKRPLLPSINRNLYHRHEEVEDIDENEYSDEYDEPLNPSKPAYQSPQFFTSERTRLQAVTRRPYKPTSIADKDDYDEYEDNDDEYDENSAENSEHNRPPFDRSQAKRPTNELQNSLQNLRDRVKLSQKRNENNGGVVNSKLQLLAANRAKTTVTATSTNADKQYVHVDDVDSSAERDSKAPNVKNNVVSLFANRSNTNRTSTVANTLSETKINLSLKSNNTRITDDVSSHVVSEAEREADKQFDNVDYNDVDDDDDDDDDNDDDVVVPSTNDKGNEVNFKRRFQKYQFNRARYETTTTTTTAAPTTTTSTTRAATNQFTSKQLYQSNRNRTAARTNQVNALVDDKGDDDVEEDGDYNESDVEGEVNEDSTITTTESTLTTSPTPTLRRIRVLKYRRPVGGNNNATLISSSVSDSSNSTNSSVTNTTNTVSESLNTPNSPERQVERTRLAPLNSTYPNAQATHIESPVSTEQVPIKRFRKIIRKLIRPVNRTTEALLTNETKVGDEVTTKTTITGTPRINGTRYGFGRGNSFRTQPVEAAGVRENDTISENNKLYKARMNLYGKGNRTPFGNGVISGSTEKQSETYEEETETDTEIETDKNTEVVTATVITEKPRAGFIRPNAKDGTTVTSGVTLSTRRPFVLSHASSTTKTAAENEEDGEEDENEEDTDEEEDYDENVDVTSTPVVEHVTEIERKRNNITKLSESTVSNGAEQTLPPRQIVATTRLRKLLPDVNTTTAITTKKLEESTAADSNTNVTPTKSTLPITKRPFGLLPRTKVTESENETESNTEEQDTAVITTTTLLRKPYSVGSRLKVTQNESESYTEDQNNTEVATSNMPRRTFGHDAQTDLKLNGTQSDTQEEEHVATTTKSTPLVRPTFRRKLVARRPYVPPKVSGITISTTVPTSPKPKGKFVRRKFGRFHPFNAANRNTGEGFVRTDPRDQLLPEAKRFRIQDGKRVPIPDGETLDEDEEYEEYEYENDEEEEETNTNNEPNKLQTPIPIVTIRPVTRPTGLLNKPPTTLLNALRKKAAENEAENEENVVGEDENEEEEEEEDEDEDEDEAEAEAEEDVSASDDDTKEASPKFNTPTYHPKDNRVPPGARPALPTTSTPSSGNVPFNSRARQPPSSPAERANGNRFGIATLGNTRVTNRPRVVNRPQGVLPPNLPLKPIATTFERTTPVVPTKPAPFIPTNTRSYERKYTATSTETPETVSDNSLIEDLNIEALNARNKKIFDINSKKHTTLKPKIATPGANQTPTDQQQDTQDHLKQNTETENDDAYTADVGGSEQGYITTTPRTSAESDTNTDYYVNANEISSQDNGSVGERTIFTTPQTPTTTLLHVFTLSDDEQTNRPPTDSANTIGRLVPERAQPKHKVVEINRIVEITSKADKLRRKSKSNQEFLKPIGESQLQVESLPYLEQLGEISVVKFVHLVDGSDISVDGHSTVTDYTPIEATASAPVRNSLPEGVPYFVPQYAYSTESAHVRTTLEQRNGKALIPEVIRSAVETSTISLEGLFESGRQGKELNSLNNVYYIFGTDETTTTSTVNINANENETQNIEFTTPSTSTSTSSALATTTTLLTTETTTTTTASALPLIPHSDSVNNIPNEVSKTLESTTIVGNTVAEDENTTYMPLTANSTTIEATFSEHNATLVEVNSNLVETTTSTAIAMDDTSSTDTPVKSTTYVRAPTATTIVTATAPTRRPVVSVRRRKIISPNASSGIAYQTATTSLQTSQAAAATTTTTNADTSTKSDELLIVTTELPTTTFNKQQLQRNRNKLVTPAAPTATAATTDDLTAPTTTTATQFTAAAAAAITLNNANNQKSYLNTKYRAKLAAASLSTIGASLATETPNADGVGAAATIATASNDIIQQANVDTNTNTKQPSTVLRRKFQARRLITTTTASATDDSVTEQPRTPNPLFKRRFSLSVNPSATTVLSSTTITPADALTTTLFVDGFDAEDASDQVAKSSVLTNHFNQFVQNAEDNEAQIPQRALSSGVKASPLKSKPHTAATTTHAPLEPQPPYVESITRRMGTIAATTEFTEAKRKSVGSKRRPQKYTPPTPQTSTESLVLRRGQSAKETVNQRRPNKYAAGDTFERLNGNQAAPVRPTTHVSTPKSSHRQVIDYDYYDDENERVVGNTEGQQLKVILHGRGIIECLDQGNFPHPLSCRKFISCAKFETGGVVGWEYTCPKGLSYDPVGGMCNWAAGLGCKE